MKLPWVKWFPREWLSEQTVAKASPAARGIWREALDVMISNDTYMLEASSRHDLAAVLRCRVEDVNAALPNLKASGLGDVTLESNGAVTLVSRRLKREWLARKNGRDRVAKFRKKPPCNENDTSVSVSGSVSPPRGESEGSCELPRGFPTTPDDAIALCAGFCADAVFITTLWNGAMARNGQDGLGRLILSWSHYVAKHWPKEQARRFEEKKKQNPHAAEERARAERTRRLLG